MASRRHQAHQASQAHQTHQRTGQATHRAAAAPVEAPVEEPRRRGRPGLAREAEPVSEATSAGAGGATTAATSTKKTRFRWDKGLNRVLSAVLMELVKKGRSFSIEDLLGILREKEEFVAAAEAADQDIKVLTAGNLQAHKSLISRRLKKLGKPPLPRASADLGYADIAAEWEEQNGESEDGEGEGEEGNEEEL